MGRGLKTLENNNIFTVSHLRQYLSYLIELVKIKKSLYVKARDLKTYLMIDDHLAVTRFGILLNKLAEAGLAIRWNNSRPIRYTLVPKNLWRRFAEVCNFNCVGCPLEGVCPYHVLLDRFSNLEKSSLHLAKVVGGGNGG